MAVRSLVPGACLLGLAVTAIDAASVPSRITYHKDVLPILQARCQGCHRPGEVAPMSFLTYQDTRPWAKAIREAVLTRKMPPWFADPHFGKFQNDRSLSSSEIATLVGWADGGAAEGDVKDAPKPLTFADGWAIGKPDLVIEMPNEFAVPAQGAVEYQYIVIPLNLTGDKWVQLAEARPGNRQLVHHIIAFLRPPDSKWMRDAKPGIPFVPQRRERSSGRQEGDGAPAAELLVGFAPGLPPTTLKPGQAKL